MPEHLKPAKLRLTLRKLTSPSVILSVRYLKKGPSARLLEDAVLDSRAGSRSKEEFRKGGADNLASSAARSSVPSWRQGGHPDRVPIGTAQTAASNAHRPAPIVPSLVRRSVSACLNAHGLHHYAGKARYRAIAPADACIILLHNQGLFSVSINFLTGELYSGCGTFWISPMPVSRMRTSRPLEHG
jgi:hypothetical protein